VTDFKTEKFVVNIDPDLLEIIPDFFAFRYRDLEMISHSLEVGDFDKLRIIGHNLKGAGGGYGFDAISEIGQRIEQASEIGAVDEITACAAELEDYLRRVEVCYL
jgi:HPt (histidine-containing phosphotransfer) domain-containing protein